MGITRDMEITIIASGSDETEAVDALVELISSSSPA